MAYIIGIEGGFGQGKTLTAVLKAHQWAGASGAQVWANFPLYGAYLFDDYTDWYRIADAHGSIIIFDESQSNWDSRTYAGSGQIAMTQVMNFVRKLNTILIYIAPSYNNIDNRVRDKTDILISCHKPLKNGPIYNMIFDYTDKGWGPKGRFLNRWTLPYESQQRIRGLKLYNTYSMVARFPLPAQTQIAKFFKELERRHDAAINRIYGQDEMRIDMLAKEDLEHAV